MDNQRFDRFTRVLASGKSRREMLRLLASGSVGALALGATVINAGAQDAEPLACNSHADCQDSNPCTFNRCFHGHCVTKIRPNGAKCPDDGNFCTTDICYEGVCVHPPKPDGTPCPDGDPNVDSDCVAGICTSV